MHRTEVRRDRQRMEQLLHPDFKEIGRSGKVYSRADILVEFDTEKPLPEIDVSEVALEQLSEEIALLTYVSCHHATEDKRRTRRSSIWLKNGEGWQVRFHQGTALLDSD